MKKIIFTVEPEAFEGVKRIAGKVALDFEKVSSCDSSGHSLPEITEAPPSVPLSASSSEKYDYSIIFATLGKSPLTEKLISEGKFDPSGIKGKREVYQIKMLNEVGSRESGAQESGAQTSLLICGSDKRGTIYGMFALSEYIGVSPLHFWGDVEPVRKENIEINKDIETISKEPSVKYRGFFINDEWPCFGNWTFNRFGGFTSVMYDHVFELLLRLKGNYLWPAMWTSSFPLDGPGSLNEELADIYGVVMGASHHEPCLRASEEWDKVRGPQSEYGNEWNYYTNKNGLLKYWEDGLKRSGKYEKIITIGMRGERDSSMLGGNSTLKENIDLLKDIIKNQRELIKKHVNHNINEVPQVIALYKEVEEYYYGNEHADGLKNWEELDGVICMLCEDNFGFMRTLPTEEIRARKGGFGMYYHFDYHGGPVSYEWMPSTSFERTWEQMCMAYDYGISDIWIVNVGDLKFNEVLLSYFMSLAYDFEKWGTKSINSINNYTSLWLEKTFPSVDTGTREKMSLILHNFIRMNAMRRPEALNADIYHPCHYNETDRMLALADNIETMNEEVFSNLETENQKDAFYSMIYFPAMASINLLRMHLYAAKNKHYAKQGKKIANKYYDLVTESIKKDRQLCEEFAQFKNCKWKGMELEQHIGFIKWNEDNSRYPLRTLVEPVYKPRMVISRKDREEIYTKTYGGPMILKIDDFLYAGNSEVVIEIANDGIGSIDYTIKYDQDSKENSWLEISSLKGTIDCVEEITLRCNRQKLAALGDIIQTARIFIHDNETTVIAEIKAKTFNTENLPPLTFLENSGVITIEANHYCSKKDVKRGCFTELENYGRSSVAKRMDCVARGMDCVANRIDCGSMKVFPTTAEFDEKEEKPSLTYRIMTENTDDYTIEIWTTPANSVQNKRPLRFMLTAAKNKTQIITAVSAEVKAGNPDDEDWRRGVLDNIRVSKANLSLEKGIQEITISALEAGLILERILIYRKEDSLLKSYLGPRESFFVK